MIDICFVGNSSIDHIITKNGKFKTFGGSALYTSFSCRYSSENRVAIISNVNDKLKKELEKNKIEIIGNVSPLVEFKINEIDGTCVAEKYYDSNISITENLNINHLHVSFRKGVNIDNILKNPKIKYNILSIDVMLHSVKEYIPYIIKYLEKIDILFCNMEEYSLIKDIVQKIPIKIITNEDKPVIVIKENENLIFKPRKANKIISTTGAGDTFIGGFLSDYVNNKNIHSAVIQGIYNSSVAIKKVGYLNSEDLLLKFDVKERRLPNNIIVIGNSCAGKTTFIEFLKQYFTVFTDIDDLEPLLEVFMMDDVSTDENEEMFKKVDAKIKFMHDIYNEYLSDFDNINHYSKKSKNGKGHDIVRPILWDLILENAITGLHQQNNIIQFSRGLDSAYEKEVGKDIYGRSIKLILNKLPNPTNSIIINLTSDLDVRKKRNADRFARGGHFVSEETMEQVYGQDIFVYNDVHDNCGYIDVDGMLYPVVTIINNDFLTPIELKKFLLYNLNRVIEYYNSFKEE